MLPFLAKKKLSNVTVYQSDEKGNKEPISEEGEPTPELVKCAEDLISAIHSKDATAVAKVLKDILKD